MFNTTESGKAQEGKIRMQSTVRYEYFTYCKQIIQIRKNLDPEYIQNYTQITIIQADKPSFFMMTFTFKATYFKIKP